MNELQTILGDTVTRLFADHVSTELIQKSEKGLWSADLWRQLEENGLTRILVPEAQGGAGGSWSDAMIVIKAAGEHGAPVPIAETNLAAWLLSQAGLAIPAGPITVFESGDNLSVDGASNLQGRVGRVPWARHAGHGVTVLEKDSRPHIVLAPLTPARVEPDKNLALEPRDDVLFDNVAVECAPVGQGPGNVKLFGALVRAGQMAGALQFLLDQSVTYANDRKQFGRPIGKFQAVQQELAVLATHVAAAGIVADTAARRAGRDDCWFEIATAKIRCDEAASRGAGIAHQVHGAIGFTYEHKLHFATRRLWSWRAEFGAGAYWAEEIGRQAMARGADALWPYITSR